MRSINEFLIKSWTQKDDAIHSTKELIQWVNELNKSTFVNIKECSLNTSSFWFYDDYNGEILNRKRSFFSIKGLRTFVDEQLVCEQPIIIQPEIGYLGIICKEINGILYFLMQAKIEPGNINCVQISPTIQATKSNFTRAHGGNLPAYFKYFEESEKYVVIYDQIQSEQSTRFYKKRNRNMIMIVNENIEVLPNFKWMTLGQIKELMKIDNLVNMDTRTVLSGIPFIFANVNKTETSSNQIRTYFSNQDFYNSIFIPRLDVQMPMVFQKINNFKMFKDIKSITVPINQLVDWTINDFGITCKRKADFCVRYYDIEIAGREVRNWTQPLFKAMGMAIFALFMKRTNNTVQFLIRLTPEIGCFDKVELGATIQWESTYMRDNNDFIEQFFENALINNREFNVDVMLSEEGGRFYHEQNRNIIMEINESELEEIPSDYIWLDYGTLNCLIQFNNNVNIQLRNLLSLLEI